MISCPRCGQSEVFEERFIPLPSGKLRMWKRMLASFIKMLFIGFQALLALAILAAILASIIATNSDNNGGQVIQDWFRLNMGCVPPMVLFNPCAVILIGAFIIAAFQFLTTLTIGWLSNISTSLRLKKRPLHEWPRMYIRTCPHCGDHRVWHPGSRRSVGVLDEPGSLSCPQCGRVVTLEYEDASKPCPHCGTILPVPKAVRREKQYQRLRAYQPYIQALASQWEGTFEYHAIPIPQESDHLTVIFNTYRRALGEDPWVEPGYQPAGYVRRTPLKDTEVHLFTRAYLHLLRGETEQASRWLLQLTKAYPNFPEPWIWLTAVEDDPDKRMTFLKEAVELDPAHPLAVDALSLLRGDDYHGEPEVRFEGRTLTLVRCPRCGGRLTDDPARGGVVCAYCGEFIDFLTTELGEAPLVSTLRLQRINQERRWEGMGTCWRCQGCGAELIMTRRLAENCLYCGSLNLRLDRGTSLLASPEALLHFEISKADAEESVRDSMMMDPEIRALADEISLGDMDTFYPLYIPYWRFDGEVETRWLVRKGQQVTSTYPGTGTFFKGVHLPAVATPSPSLLDGLSPFPLRRSVTFEPEHLADHPAQIHDIDVTLVVEDAYDIMLWMAQWKEGLQVTTTGDRKSTAYRVFQVSQTTYQLVLVPVWVARVRRNGYLHLVLVNGVTGRAAIGSPQILE